MNFSGDTIKAATHPLEAIIKAGGIVGLLAVMGMGFLMYVFYSGIEKINASQDKFNEGQQQEIRILNDMLYTMKAQNGVVYRNNPNNPNQ